MAKEIVWTEKAQNDREKILKYWISRTGSEAYSIKLNFRFIEIVTILAEYPAIGKISEVENIRFKIVSDYKIFYTVSPDTINIITVWDTRQDPEQLKENLR